MKNSSKFNRILYIIVLLSMIGSIIFVSIRIFFAPTQIVLHSSRSKADYILMLLQSLLGVVVIHLPSFVEKRFSFEIPNHMITAYLVFLYCAIYLGEVRSFYYLVPNWDTYLHAMSAASLATLGFSFVSILNNMEEIDVVLSPVFVALFAFSFAVSLGAIWEIYEFVGDGLFKINMQKYALSDGTQLIGHEALRDTMKDIIVDVIGAFLSSTVGYFFLRYKPKEERNKFIIRKHQEIEK